MKSEAATLSPSDAASARRLLRATVTPSAGTAPAAAVSTPPLQLHPRSQLMLASSSPNSSSAQPMAKKKVKYVASRYMSTVSKPSQPQRPQPHLPSTARKPTVTTTAAHAAAASTARSQRKPAGIGGLAGGGPVVTRPRSTSTPSVQTITSVSNSIASTKVVPRSVITGHTTEPSAPSQQNIRQGPPPTDNAAAIVMNSSTHAPASEPVVTENQNHHRGNVQEQILLARTRLIQWMTIDARLQKSIEAEKAAANSQIYAVWQYLQLRKRRLAELQRAKNVDEVIAQYQPILQVQETCLKELEKVVVPFRHRLALLADALKRSSMRLKLKGVVIVDPDGLKSDLIEGSRLIRRVLDGNSEAFSQLDRLAKNMSALAVTSDEVAEAQLENGRLEDAVEAGSEVLESFRMERIQRGSNLM